MSEKIVVRFLKSWRGYSVDELAGFDPAVVEGLELKGFAEVYEDNGTGSKSKPTKGSASKPGNKKTAGKGARKDQADDAGGEGGEGGEGSDGGAGTGDDGADDAKP
ncbi:hypothetical protein [Pseudomonas veronii]|uniref:hypothetical protein n=1 Tax=Pseudomonas veronii TaxID=76761 RepID=UPI00163BCE20|nr:hypothetical protein [Pseudomonas veronii]